MRRPHGDGDCNQAVTDGGERASAVVHSGKYIIGGEARCGGEPLTRLKFRLLFDRLNPGERATLETAETGTAMNTPLAGAPLAAGAEIRVWLGCGAPDFFVVPAA